MEAAAVAAREILAVCSGNAGGVWVAVWTRHKVVALRPSTLGSVLDEIFSKFGWLNDSRLKWRFRDERKPVSMTL